MNAVEVINRVILMISGDPSTYCRQDAILLLKSLRVGNENVLDKIDPREDVHLACHTIHAEPQNQ